MTHSIDMEILMIMIFLMQALLYQQDNETVFTVEYDIAKQVICCDFQLYDSNSVLYS